jgi:hexulose-6-phosphate isomerase
MEWTIDSHNFLQNPLVVFEKQLEILDLCKTNSMYIPSVTCDYFMENPPWQMDPNQLSYDIKLIIDSMSNVGSKILVIPLVDNSSLKNLSNILVIKDFFIKLIPELDKAKVVIAFESDFAPNKLLEFIGLFEKKYFGINYDIGNSASLGLNPTDEFKAYGSRIINVHVKDRKLGGITVPLGEGDVDFPEVFYLLHKTDYKGNFILQTARSKEGKHEEVLVKYKKLVENWWKDAKIA